LFVKTVQKRAAAEIVILDGPHVVVVSNDQSSLIIKDLETGLTYTFIVGLNLTNVDMYLILYYGIIDQWKN